MNKWLQHPVTLKISEFLKINNFTGNVLGIGSSAQPKDMLNLPYFKQEAKAFNLIGINICGAFGKYDNFEVFNVNAHNTPFSNQYFDIILCNAMLEHDPEFWKTIKEVNRILRNGGLFIVNVPGYINLKTDTEESTLTYKVHGLDYYRFSEMSVKDVIMFGMKDVVINSILIPPRIIGCGKK